jgi:hypothetical protein
MKKFIVCFVAAGMFISCSNESKPTETAESTEKKEEAKPAETPSPAPAINMPYTAGYSSQFVLGDQKNSEKLLTLFKQWDENKVADGKTMFGDSVHFYADKWEFHGTNDSFMTVSKKQRANYKEVKTVVQAWIPVHSTDKNEDWVLVWSTAYTTDMKGKVDSANYQDTWRINKDGKFDLMYDYQQRVPEPAKKK